MASQQVNPVSFFATPDQASQIQDADFRRQYFADMLRRSQEPIPTQMVGNVVARNSWTQYAAQLAGALLGAQGMRQANADLAKGYAGQMESMRRMMGGGDPSALADNPTPGSPSALGRGPGDANEPPPPSAVRQGADAGSIGPTNDNARRLGEYLAAQRGGGQNPIAAPVPKVAPQSAPLSQQQATQRPAQPQQRQSQSPLNPLGLDPTLAAGFYMSDPLKYFETVASQMAPTETMKTARGAGLQPGTPEYIALMRATLDKQNYIAPTAIRPGGGIQDPRTGNITTLPAAPPTGYNSQRQLDGSWAYQPVQGGLQAITNSTAATESGKAPFQLIEGYDPTTKAPFKNFAGNLLQTPSVGSPGGNAPAPGVGTQVSNAAPRQSPTLSRIDTPPPQNYTPEALQILRAERAKPTNTPEDNAALDREIARVTSRVVLPGTQPPGIQTGPALGDAQGQVNSQNELSEAWKKQQQAHQSAQTNLATMAQMRDLIPQAAMGYEAQRRQLLAQLGAYVGLPAAEKTATASDLFNKFGSQLIVGLASRGLDTDAARALVESRSPNSKMQPEAAREAIDNLMSREQMTQARTQALQAFAQNRDPAGFQGAASKFDKAADPRVWQWMAIQDPKQRAEPPRVSRRLNTLRGLSHEQVEQVLARGA